MTSQGRVCLDWRMWRDMEFHILGAATRKARAPNENKRLCRGTESKWLQMNAWTLQTCDIVRAWSGMAGDQ